MMAAVFASFATEDFASKRDALCDSALQVGFDRAVRFSPRDYEGTVFDVRNRHILSQQRGAGYWLWKPWLILKQLESMEPADLLVYSDAGRSQYYLMKEFPSCLAEIARSSDKGFLLGPTIGQHGPLANWTKRDCLKLLEMDSGAYLKLPIIQATWSFWYKTEASIQFLRDWVAYCEDDRCLTDKENTLGEPNYPGFRDHRHDQSVLTLLAYKLGAPYINMEGTVISRLLRIRPKSELANLFLKRIDDAEGVVKGGALKALTASYIDLRKMRR